MFFISFTELFMSWFNVEVDVCATPAEDQTEAAVVGMQTLCTWDDLTLSPELWFRY